MVNEAASPGAPAAAAEAAPTGRRGLLDIKIMLSNPSPTAGSEFTVYMLVTNTFDIPIWPQSPQVFLPSELQSGLRVGPPQPFSALLERVKEGDFPQPANAPRRPWTFLRRRPSYARGIEDKLKYMAAQTVELDKELTQIDQDRAQIKAQMDQATAGKSLEEKRKLYLADEQVRVLAARDTELAGRAEGTRQRMTVLRNTVVTLTGSWAVIANGDLDISNLALSHSMYLQAGGQIRMDSVTLAPVQALSGSSLTPQFFAIQPGNTVVYSLVLATRRSVFFRPIEYNLQYSINFSFESPQEQPRVGSSAEVPVHTNYASQSLTIRAPIGSVMIGAIFGGLAGYLARTLQTVGQLPTGKPATNWVSFLVTLAVTVILSAMAVVFLARKSETQSLVSIEDFWGGLVIGFLVGYTGTSAFESFAGLSPATGTPAAGATPLPK